jgi:hypothetical protein
MPTNVIVEPVDGTSPANYVIYLSSLADEIPAWGSSPATRDKALREFWPTEPILASAVYSTASRYAALDWILEGPPKTVSEITNWIHGVEQGEGWIPFMLKTLVDLFTTDNGAFIEVVRTGDSPTAPVISLNHLDSCKCVRTGIHETPVTYYDMIGKGHLLKWYQVIALAEMPSPIQEMRGMQMCLFGDSTIKMASGEARRISDLVKEKCTDSVVTIDDFGNYTTRPIVGWYTNELAGRQLVNIRPCSRAGRGRQDRNSWVTEDHPIKTPSGWVSAGELKSGDKVITAFPAPSKEQMELIIGTVLGDASLVKSEYTTKLSFRHNKKNEDWVYIKGNCLTDFGWTPFKEYNSTIPSATHAQVSFNGLWDAFYTPSGVKIIPLILLKKYLSPRLLATWYLDDGSICNREPNPRNRRPTASIATCSFTKDEVDVAVEILTKAGYECHTVSQGYDYGGYWNIKFTVEGSQALFEDIAKYVPESMRYKLPYGSEAFDSSAWDISRSQPFVDTVIVHRIDPPSIQTVYCIDIEETHNFITANIVVHNCAVSRMLRAAQILRDISIYKKEKISGRFTRAVHLIGGIQTRVIEDAFAKQQAAADASGLMRYIQPVILGSLDPTATVSVATLQLANLPDGFDEETNMRWYINQLALAFGSDYQDFAPLPAGNLGTSQQSVTLDRKGRGKGTRLFMTMVEHIFNHHGILPSTVKFEYTEHDISEEASMAQLRAQRSTTRATRIASGELTPQVAREIAVDEEDLDEKYLVELEEDDAEIKADEEAKAQQQLELEEKKIAAKPAAAEKPDALKTNPQQGKTSA